MPFDHKVKASILLPLTPAFAPLFSARLILGGLVGVVAEVGVVAVDVGRGRGSLPGQIVNMESSPPVIRLSDFKKNYDNCYIKTSTMQVCQD